MKMSTRGLMMLCHSEAIVLKPYKDSKGFWTIGVGHTAAAGGLDPKTMRGKKLSVDQCFALLRKDIQKYEREVLAALKGAEVSQHQFDALVHFHYNTGGIARAKLTKHVRAGRHSQAAAGFMGWAKDKELRQRRRDEQALYERGIYTGNGKAPCFDVKPSGQVDWGSGKTIDLTKHLRPSHTAETGAVAVIVSGGALAAERATKGEINVALAIGCAAIVAAIAVFVVVKRRRK